MALNEDDSHCGDVTHETEFILTYVTKKKLTKKKRGK